MSHHTARQEIAMQSSESNKATVARLFDAFRAGDTDAFDELIVEDYKQHNPLVGNGRQTVKDFFAQFGAVDVDVHRVIAEGDLVAVHAHYKTLNSAGVDIFRFNEDGKIVEHWDVLQEVPTATASGNDMFSQVT
jgi:predicted SnoaL-like aldol condensation-catalyzing enzyme